MPPSEQWSPGTNPVKLAADEIHVWRARLECSGQILRQFEATLAPDEIARADRFFFPRDRNSFVATRGLLRRLLANYLQSVPADIAIANHPRGKPFVAADSGKQLEFNVSHSHGMALLAFSMGRQVGVDVEFIRGEIASEEIAERFFAQREIAELRSLPSAQRAEGFFLCWTRKEAYVKALGDGLQMPLTSFCVSLTPAKPATLESADSARWMLKSLDPAPGYAGAIVGEGKDWRTRLFDFPMQELLGASDRA